jgi:hypothetical protein
MKHERRTPIEKRIRLDFQGEQKRLKDIASSEEGVVFLIQQLLPSFGSNKFCAILSELNRVGYGWGKIMEEVKAHPDWGVDPGVLQQY